MPATTKSAAVTPAGVVLRVISSTPLPAAEVRRRAREVLRAAGLDVFPALAAPRAKRLKITRAEALAKLDAAVGKLEQQAAAAPPMSDEEVAAEVQLGRQEHYERRQASAKK